MLSDWFCMYERFGAVLFCKKKKKMLCQLVLSNTIVSFGYFQIHKLDIYFTWFCFSSHSYCITFLVYSWIHVCTYDVRTMCMSVCLFSVYTHLLFEHRTWCVCVCVYVSLFVYMGRKYWLFVYYYYSLVISCWSVGWLVLIKLYIDWMF